MQYFEFRTSILRLGYLKRSKPWVFKVRDKAVERNKHFVTYLGFCDEISQNGLTGKVQHYRVWSEPRSVIKSLNNFSAGFVFPYSRSGKNDLSPTTSWLASLPLHIKHYIIHSRSPRPCWLLHHELCAALSDWFNANHSAEKLNYSTILSVGRFEHALACSVRYVVVIVTHSSLGGGSDNTTWWWLAWWWFVSPINGPEVQPHSISTVMYSSLWASPTIQRAAWPGWSAVQPSRHVFWALDHVCATAATILGTTGFRVLPWTLRPCADGRGILLRWSRQLQL